MVYLTGYEDMKKSCENHVLAIPPSLHEAGNWKETFKKKRGYKPKKCKKCGYLIFEEGTVTEKLRNLKGSIKDDPEKEKYLVNNGDL